MNTNPIAKPTSHADRVIGLLLVLLGGFLFVLCGSAMAHRSPDGMCDFDVVYYHDHVLIKGQDPYKEVPATYAEMYLRGFLDPKSTSATKLPYFPCMYPPTALAITSPFGFLPWRPAHVLWMVLLGSSLILSGVLVWEMAAEYAPILAGALIGAFLANSATVLFEGNAGGLAVGLCIIAVWCFFRERFAVLGVVCLALSLALKPHDSGILCIGLLLLGTSYRKRAIQSMLVSGLLALASVVWVTALSAHWFHEWRSNIQAITAPGAPGDPGPFSAASHVVNSAIDAQAFFSVIWDNPRFYASVTYLLCAALWLTWAIATWRRPPDRAHVLLSIGFLATLSLLPVYHWIHDAKLILLAIPCSCQLLSVSRSLARWGIAITMAALAATADLPRAILTFFVDRVHLPYTTVSGKLFALVFARPAPLCLLATCIFFLYVYVRHAPAAALRTPQCGSPVSS